MSKCTCSECERSRALARVEALHNKIKRIEDEAPCAYLYDDRSPRTRCEHPKLGHDRHFEHAYVQPRWLANSLGEPR